LTPANLHAAYGIAIDVEAVDGSLSFRRKRTHPAARAAGRDRDSLVE
jgi:hypothetical protein